MNINSILDALCADPKASKTTIVGDRYSITIQVAAVATIASHGNPPAAPPPARNPPERMPVPSNVYYHPPTKSFWHKDGVQASAMFVAAWQDRAEEFPTWMGPGVP